jgi:hypothetical protein
MGHSVTQRAALARRADVTQRVFAAAPTPSCRSTMRARRRVGSLGAIRRLPTIADEIGTAGCWTRRRSSGRERG